MDENDVIISLRDVWFSWEQKLVFQGITIDIARHKITAIMGPSGTGKTTLLSLIGAQIQPASGAILLEGQDIVGLGRRERYAMREKLGVLFQEGGLFTDLDVFENVAFPLREHTDLPEEMIRDMVLMVLEAVGLRGASGLPIHALSGGMARRVALARSVIRSPQIMFYDEPFSGQDPIGRGVLLKLIKALNGALGMTSLVVSHDVQETAEIADYVYILFEGRVMGQGTPEALFKQSQSDAVMQFIQGLPDGPVSFHYPGRDYGEDLRQL